MPEEELFNDQENVSKPPPIEVDEESGQVKIGEKTYANVQEALKGKFEADQHIELIHRENKELREKLETNQEKQSSAYEKILERLERDNRGRGSNEEFEDTDYKDNNSESQEKLSPEEIRREAKKEVEAFFKEKEEQAQNDQLQKTFDENRGLIRKELEKALGSKEAAVEAYRRYKESEDFDQDIFNSQILRQPGKVVKEIKDNAPVYEGSTPMTIGGLPGRTAGGVEAGPKPWSYYSKLLAENPRKYYTPEVQIALKKDMSSVGKERFFAK